MPRKAMYTKEQITGAAYKLARCGGMEAVVSRSVANELGCTTMPIFSFFTNMEELRNEVYEKAKRDCIRFMSASLDYRPAFKEFGLRWVKFACEEPHLFTMLFTSDPAQIIGRFSGIFDPITQSIMDSFALSDREARELLDRMIIYANGVACFLMHKPELLTQEELGRMLSDVCTGLVMTLKLKNGTFDESFARRMLDADHLLPVRFNGENNE